MIYYGDYYGSAEDEFIDGEAEELEDAMDDLIVDSGSDIDAVIGDAEVDMSDAECIDCDDDNEEDDYITYVIDNEEE